MSHAPPMPADDETMDASVSLGLAHTASSSRRARSPVTLTKGERLGRYVVLRQLGAGAMGTVYLSYDPELDRGVALKLLSGDTNDDKRQALIREAQAMAKLAHPNVVGVHDVGEHEGRVYVAMEFVEGGTLEQWLAAEARSWREVLDMFSRAGRGLEAAHASGLIHRDFKPDNVMVSAEGRVLVMDFGLARPSSSSRASRSSSELSESELLTMSSSLLTKATIGRIAGTPAYMAPEQIAAQELTPASDQFAFCVSIWEALCGQRPFKGESVPELFASVLDAHITPPPSSARMPRWLERVLRRGLAHDGEDRWPSMAALLAALDRGRGRWRWQAGLGAGAMAVAIAGAVIGAREQDLRERRARITACEAEGATVDTIWNEPARERLRTGLLATGASFAPRSVEILIPWLDDYKDAWSRGRSEACLHHSVARDWDPERYDRSAWCFEDRQLQLEATVAQIASSSPKAARRAIRLASYMDPVTDCLDPKVLERLPAPPAEQRAEIRSIRATLSAADSLRHAGEFSEALAVARPARARAEALGWPPLLAAAQFIEGRCLMISGQFEHADTALNQAYFTAQSAGSVEVAFRAARSLMTNLHRQGRDREAEVWSRHAMVLASRLDDPLGLDEAEHHYLLVKVYEGLGELDKAAEHGERARAMRVEALGAEHPITASAARRLGEIYLAQGRPQAALELFESAYAVWEDAVGCEHPYVAELTTLRGQALLELGQLDVALELSREGLALSERVLRPDHPALALRLDALAEVYVALGRLDEAAATRARATTIRTP